jgi:hypothetical protein
MKPTVSQLLSLLDKPWLLKWANKIWLDWIKIEDYKKKSTSEWTSLHYQIERYILYNEPFKNKEHQENFDKLFKDKSILKVEENIETDYFKGRLDIKIEGRQKYICDFKSSWNIYFENKLQLAAYRMANPEYKIWIIEIPSFIFKPIEIEQEMYESILINLSNIWITKQKLNLNFY